MTLDDRDVNLLRTIGDYSYHPGSNRYVNVTGVEIPVSDAYRLDELIFQGFAVCPPTGRADIPVALTLTTKGEQAVEVTA